MTTAKPRMGVDKFLRELAKTKPKGGWYLTDSGAIRCGKRLKQCPITYVAGILMNKRYPNLCYVFLAAKDIGLSGRVLAKLVEAADADSNCDKKLRNKLLKATRLKQEKEASE